MDAAGWMDTLLKDIRYSARQLGRNRVFTLVAVLSLAIGIGANTAIFSIMNVVLLKSLPVRNPHELVLLTDPNRSEEHTSELQSHLNLVCRLLLEKKN